MRANPQPPEGHALPPPPTGWWGTLRRGLDTGLALLHLRLELAALELEEEKRRLFAALVWAGLGLLLLGMGCLLAIAGVLWSLPAAWRPMALGLAAVLTLACGAALLWHARAAAAAPEGLLPTTRDELRQDREALSASVRADRGAAP